MTKGRMEAFSDGVFAVIITIMVLEMKSPQGTGLAALQPLLPVFFSYVLSFVYRRHLLEQPSSPPAGGEACYGRHPVGESAFVVLALVDPRSLPPGWGRTILRLGRWRYTGWCCCSPEPLISF